MGKHLKKNNFKDKKKRKKKTKGPKPSKKNQNNKNMNKHNYVPCSESGLQLQQNKKSPASPCNIKG